MAAETTDLPTVARTALEQACSRRDLGIARELYSAQFLDHVNDHDYVGHEGIRESFIAYRQVFDEMQIAVDDQVVDGDQVASRWTLRGTLRGRSAEMKGITISRFVDGKIVEDWSVSDAASLVGQLGLLRTGLIAVRRLRRARPA